MLAIFRSKLYTSLVKLYLFRIAMWKPSWRGGRVVVGNGLENRRAGNGTVGSNPTPSASIYKPLLILLQSVQLTPCAWRGTQVAEGAGLLNL